MMKNTYAVIFTSERTDQDHAGYEEMANRMTELAKTQKGFLGLESVRDLKGFGITISYWQTLEDIQNWKANSEHLTAQQRGRADWYRSFKTKICKIEHETYFKEAQVVRQGQNAPQDQIESTNLAIKTTEARIKELGPNFSVRKAVGDDATAIGTVHTESWKTTYKGIVHQSFLDSIDLSKRIIGAENRIKNSNTECLVLVENKSLKVIGFADVGPCREKNVDSDGELYAIYLFQDYQGKGGGKLLFDAAVTTAKEKGYSKMMVSVLEKNTSSRKFYEKMGGEYVGNDHVDIEEHRYPTSTYIWKLKK